MTHLTFEQCQKLKELGFPQEQEEGFTYFQKVVGEGNYLLHSDSDQYPGTDPTACPTLEELIEWFDEFYSLLYNYSAKANKRFWTATSTTRWQCDGNTPLESVYNLAVKVKS